LQDDAVTVSGEHRDGQTRHRGPDGVELPGVTAHIYSSQIAPMDLTGGRPLLGDLERDAGPATRPDIGSEVTVGLLGTQPCSIRGRIILHGAGISRSSSLPARAGMSSVTR
jgi:hypothetical protein